MDLKYYKRYYCKDIENVENYEKALADNFVGWECHHRLETHNSDGERRLVDISHKELKALGMYYNRPASELIFLTESEHSVLHTKGKQAWSKGKKMSEEYCRKNSESHKGMRWFNNGKIKWQKNVLMVLHQDVYENKIISLLTFQVHLSSQTKFLSLLYSIKFVELYQLLSTHSLGL